MSNNSSSLAYRIGTCRSGSEMLIPDSLSETSVELFCQSLMLSDQVDLFCVSEFLALEHYQLAANHKEAILTKLLNDALRRKLKDKKFAAALLDLGLVTSIDYARFGSQMAGIQ